MGHRGAPVEEERLLLMLFQELQYIREHEIRRIVPAAIRLVSSRIAGILFLGKLLVRLEPGVVEGELLPILPEVSGIIVVCFPLADISEEMIESL